MTNTTNSKSQFSVRIAVCDYYLAKPTPGIDIIYSDFRGTDIKQVPILRIFGPALDGQKACLHVHGVFPYFYIPCPVSNPEPQFLYQIAASLDKALNIALKQATSSNQHVYKISLVKGLPFYGFHNKDHLFLKIFLYNPGLIKQAVELCSNAAILGQTFQPHESHLNFTLQFFIDFNLFGMSNIELQSVWYRKSAFSQNSSDPVGSHLKRESVCHFEVDCLACHIINRQRISKGDGIENPGLEEVWNQEEERRKQLNMSVASKSLSQGRISFDQTESHNKYQQMFLVKMSGLIDKPVKIEQDTSTKAIEVHYPAESMEGSQLIRAADISIHLPESDFSFKKELDETLIGDIDDTIVDENAALSCSLSFHHSQVLLDSDDLDLVDILLNMDDNTVEKDSVLGTPAEVNKFDDGSDSEDVEYSQVFNEDNLILTPHKSTDEVESTPSWNDSFWDGANIPQLDGTCDDDHVKKVRKRKMRPFKLGLSKPKSKKQGSKNVNESCKCVDEISKLEMDANTTANNINENIQNESSDFNNVSRVSDNGEIISNGNRSQSSNGCILDLVETMNRKDSNEKASETYDMQNQYEPLPGPSTVVKNRLSISDVKEVSFNETYESSPEENNLGIISFYNKSSLFDMTLDNPKISPVDSDNLKDVSNTAPNGIKVEFDNSPIFNYCKTEYDYSLTVNNCNETGFVYLTPKIKPPTMSYVKCSLKKYNIPKTKNNLPFFSDYKDSGDKVEIGQMVLKVNSKSAKDKKPLEKVLGTTSIEEWRQLMFLQRCEMNVDSAKPETLLHLLAGNKQYILEPIWKPPTTIEVLKWIDEKQHPNINEDNKYQAISVINSEELDNSQALGLHEDNNASLSLDSTDKDKINMNKSLQVSMQPDGSFLCYGDNDSQSEVVSLDTPVIEAHTLTVMLLEVHTSVSGEQYPDPAVNDIQAIFVTITNDSYVNPSVETNVTEILIVDDGNSPKLLDRCVFKAHITYVNNENEILDKLIQLVRKYDPDIMCGYEIEMNSWGYVLERSQTLGLQMVTEICRITEKNRQKRFRNEDNDLEGKIIGRIIFNVWRLFRHELALSSYSFENCMFEVLKERVPKYSYAELSKWWNHESRILRWIPVEYYLTKLSGTLRMLEKLDIINRTSELARLFGLQWWEVLSRGSQFRVESLMLRAARPLNLIAMSPTVKQRAAMRAPECLPLIFEPESRFYSDPVIVLDFQSLYPSMMIAYNYCFSTCIGRIQNISGDTAYEFGAWRLRIPRAKLEALVQNELVNWSPVGVGFVKPSIRRGVLPALLRRILAARQAVKKSMKIQTDDSVKKAMHSRQLGLKLIANVTYGYTAANFSGRMPCVEVGDSVVAKGRETLERAIKLVRDSKQWNAKVIYGDTDSLFVLVPGGTRAEAFEIGQQIADAVTADNPSPVALKLEKVYQPCILQTKKRYVGYMYESADQEKPVYEAKGIETVRRDGCPAGVKLLQRSLCELFESGDMSRVKRLVLATLSQLADGSLPIRELFFTREYHGSAGYRPGAAAPPNEIAKRLLSRDRRSAPRTGERVPWLVCAGAPSDPLVKLAREPRELLAEPARPHVAYYATRVLLPPLHRCLSLLGVNVFKWWNELGYSREIQQTSAIGGGIARYLWRERCAACGARGARALCVPCAERPQGPAALLVGRLSRAHRDLHYATMICNSCCGNCESNYCKNTECPVLWRRLTAQQKLAEVKSVIVHLPLQFTRENLDF